MSNTLGPQGVRTARVNVPQYGRARAELTLEEGAPPAGKLTLTIADLTILGTVLPGQTGLDAPDAPACVLLSGAGWDTPLPSPPPSWQSDNDIPIRTVLERLARIAGETLDPTTLPAFSVRLGAACVLRKGTCADALSALVLRGAIAPWWVKLDDGKTRFGPRSPVATANPKSYLLNSNNSMWGVYKLGLDGSALPFLPGNTAAIGTNGAPVVISRTVFKLTPDELTAMVWA